MISRTRSVYRCVAILFLLWTLADLFIPQLCAADASFSELSSDPDEIVTSKATGPEDPLIPDDPIQRDDDCFCCCSHVLPAFFHRTETLAVLHRVAQVPDEAMPSFLVPIPFHPPRY
jgi:hypothetical protein